MLENYPLTVSVKQKLVTYRVNNLTKRKKGLLRAYDLTDSVRIEHIL